MSTTSHDSITSGSDVIATYDVEGVNGTFTGTVSGSDATFTGNTSVTGALTITAPTLSAGTAAPTASVQPGSLYVRYNVTGAGSDVANATLYVNTSASGASGSTWTLANTISDAA